MGTLTVIGKKVFEPEKFGHFGVIWVRELLAMESRLVSLQPAMDRPMAAVKL